MRIAVTGIPASGKTTLAQTVAKQLKYRYIHAYEYAQKHNAASEFDKHRNVAIVDEKKLDNALKSAKNFVIDGHFTHALTNIDKIILVKCNRKELVKRMKQRKYSEDKIQENIEADIMEVIEDEIQKPFLKVDATKTYKPSIKKIIEWIKE